MDSNEQRYTVIRDTYERVNDADELEFGTEWIVWDNLNHTPDDWYATLEEAQEAQEKANRVWRILQMAKNG